MNDTSHQRELEAQFLEAYDTYANDIFRFLIFKTSDREVAKDLLQDTFAKTWDYCREGNEIAQWKPFLFKTAYHLVVDTYRKKRALSLDELTEAGFSPAGDPAQDGPSAEDRADLARMRAAIEELDDTYREVVLLRYTEYLTPQEIAEILDLSENVVSVRIHRAIKKLREHLGESS